MKSASLRTQMTLLVFALVFLTCFLLSIFSAETTKDMLVKRAERDVGAVLEQSIRNVEYYLNDMDSLAALSNVQSAVQRMLVSDASPEYNLSQFYEDAIGVRSVFSDLSKIRTEITSIAIAGENGTLADTSSLFYAVFQESPENLAWYDAAIKSGGKAVFLPPHAHTDYYGVTRTVISLTKPVYLSHAGAPLGAICINLNTDALGRICDDAQIGEDGYVFIADSAGNMIYAPPDMGADANMLESVLSGVQSFVSGDMLVLSQRLDAADYYVCGVVPYSQIVGSANSVRNAQILLGLLGSAAVAVIIAILLSRKVFAPLGALRALMGKVQKGDSSVRADDMPQNEIGELAGGFNKMLDHSQRLMRQNIEIEKAKRKAELDALQSQITPHFLYNTLDSIVWMAGYKPEVAASMADALAKLFRLMLGGGEDIVPLSQEFEHMTQYLIIQKMRYASKFEYEIELADNCRDIRVPKLIMQPLVENAIYHGVKPSHKKCNLKITGAIVDGELTLTVSDDGVGMSEELLSRILTDYEASDKHLGGIGVKNINERIKMYAPDNGGLSFISEPGVGTTAIIKMSVAGV